MRFRVPGRRLAPWAAALSLLAGCQSAAEVYSLVHPEQRQIVYRDPAALPPAALPTSAPPRSVSFPTNGEASRILSLDDCIRIALENSTVVRVLTGLAVVPSGQTIYDPAITNTTIDQARGRFDPILSANNVFSQDETPFGVFDPLPPAVRRTGTKDELYNLDASLSQTNPLGGTSKLRFGAVRSFLEPGVLPFNPQINYSTELGYTQPLLRGGGLEANLAPIVIARLDTERSFFQFKDSVQELVRGVIEAYWALVFARTDRWAREQQVEQAQFAYDRARGRKRFELANVAEVAQTRLALANFQSSLVAAKASVLQREAALLAILGISPTESGEVIPTSPPRAARMEFQWEQLVALAERSRPDLVELKLIIEADQQRILIAKNEGLPTLDAVALYRWDGLRGVTPAGRTLGTGGNQFTDWTLGINFSVPLGLRQGRAAERQQELLIVRDRANLSQGLLDTVSTLSLNVRNLDQYYEQYEAYSETREAARDNLLQQSSEYLNDRVILLNLLQAITDWGNSVSAQAQTLAQYNTELANLERQTGTILEAHGVRFMEERFRFAGPCCHVDRCYPAGIAPTPNADRYPNTDKPAEESFDLTNPVDHKKPEPSSESERPDDSWNPDSEPAAPSLPPEPAQLE